MNTEIITETEIASRAIASMPTRPTAPTAFGGSGYTASEMKAAFDMLPLRIIEGFNSLITEIENGAMLDALCQMEPLSSIIADVNVIKAKLGL